MKNLRIEKIESLLLYFIVFLYLEIVFKIIIFKEIFTINIINILLFVIAYSLVIKFIASLFNDKVNKVLFFIFAFLTSFMYALQLFVYKTFGFFFDLTLLGATGQVIEFASDALPFIAKSIIGLMFIFLPFILCIVFRKKIICKRITKKSTLIFSICLLITILLYFSSLFIGKNKDYSAYSLKYKTHNMEISIKKLGVVDSMLVDFKRAIFGFDEEIIIVEPVTNKESQEVNFQYNNLDIDFDSLIAKSSGTVKQMHEYFKNETGTLQNKYTNYFKDKNLILFMAESFNEVVVDETLTPTLYKLVNGGFVFDDFYTPTISSTIGGEFQELTGLVAASGFLSSWKSGENSYPYGIATSFKNLDYSTYAYHNHSYTFQNRNKYLKSLGFDNFKGCRNGLESFVNCKLWPESDIEMIEGTFNEYINSENPFFVYYVTVSGHGSYSWGNAMSKKNKDIVKDLNYSEEVKAYLAAQIELDRALELLINKLEESGKLADTVIALVGDHYPYMLSVEQVNEMTSYKKDSIVEINHSNFILWNSEMKEIHIEKVGSQIDVLPTLYNLFGVEYDSRLIIGKDILSTEPGLAIFGNRSWVSDYGTYFSNSNKFVPKDDVEIPEDYVKCMNVLVNNRMNMSKLIMTQDYYKYFK